MFVDNVDIVKNTSENVHVIYNVESKNKCESLLCCC